MRQLSRGFRVDTFARNEGETGGKAHFKFVFTVQGGKQLFVYYSLVHFLHVEGDWISWFYFRQHREGARAELC